MGRTTADHAVCFPDARRQEVAEIDGDMTPNDIVDVLRSLRFWADVPRPILLDRHARDYLVNLLIAARHGKD